MTLEHLQSWRQQLEDAGWAPDVLRPGLKPDQVGALLESAGLAPIDPLIELYSFADGTTDYEGDRRGLLFECTFRSLSEALNARAEDLSFLEPDDPAPPYLKTYLPIFEHDPTLVIDTAESDGPLVEVWWDSASQLAHRTISEFIDSHAVRLTGGELVIFEGRVKRPPRTVVLPPKRTAGFGYIAGRIEPPVAVPKVVGMLPEVLAATGVTKFRIVSLAKGSLVKNDGLEDEQAAHLRSLIENAAGLEGFTFRWETRVPEVPQIGDRHHIELFIDTGEH